MSAGATAYNLPQSMEPELAGLHAYWDGLIRAESSMPFSDDVDLTQIPELAESVLLLNAFANPQRFRIETAGKQIGQQYGTPLNGEFSDELPSRAPLDGLTEQCAETVMRRSPTYFRSEEYSRLLLPTWGDGHITLLLGAIIARQTKTG